MKLFSHLSIIRGIGYLLVFILCVNCKKDNISTNPSEPPSPESILRPGGENLVASGLTSQTRTATLLNNNFGRTLANNYPNAIAAYVEADDGIYASTIKMGPGRGGATLLLQGFNFDIPVGSTIENISIIARRFKTGKGSASEHFVSLVRKRDPLPEWWERYGAFWSGLNNLLPGIEAEANYSQSGSGVGIGGRPYQWTPAMINSPFFGVNTEVGYINGSPVVVKYDFVEITVQYSLP